MPLLVSGMFPLGRVLAQTIETPQLLDQDNTVSQDTETLLAPLQISSDNELPKLPAAQPLLSTTPPIAQGMDLSPDPIADPEIPVVEQPPLLDAPPFIITGYRVPTGATQVDFVQLYNNSDKPLLLSEWSLTFVVGSSADPLAVPRELPVSLPDVWLRPLSYAVIGWGSYTESSDIAGGSLNVLSGEKFLGIELSLMQADVYQSDTTGDLLLGADTTLWTWRDNRSTSTYKYSATAKTFRLSNYKGSPALSGRGLYELPEDVPLKIVEIVAKSRNCSPLLADVTCYDYVKLRNTSDQPFALDDFRLRSGVLGQSSGSGVALPLSGTIERGSYATVWQKADGSAISLTDSGGYVWLEDLYGLTVFAGTVQQYPSASSVKNEGQSWALDERDGQWKWGIPSPEGANRFSDHEQDAAVVTVATSQLKPCNPGQERNPATNRCRAIVSTASTLTPCKEGQERNPLTNRCRSIETASTLVPCKEGQERNPDTNRCRNVLSAATDKEPFAVTPTETPGSVKIGWIVAAVAGLMVLGYGAFEWRQELGRVIRRFKG